MSNQQDEKYLDTYTEWTEQEDRWLWEEYSEGATIGDICRALGRYPDDVITQIVTHSTVKIEDIHGFGEPDHLQLWNQQQLAFQTNPLFTLRKAIREREVQDKMYNMLRALYLRK